MSKQCQTKQKDGQPAQEEREDEARNGKRNGWGGNDGRTARNATGNETQLVKMRVVTQGRGQKRGTSDARRNGKRGVQNGGVEPVARKETERDGTGRRLNQTN